LPGLTGKFEDPYINSMVNEFLDKGFSHIYVYNYRLLSKKLKIDYEHVDLVEDL
jgi:predicted alpha/beta-fold hydrolase